VLRSVLAYTLAVPIGWGATGIWYGEAVSNVLMAMLVYAYFRRGTWANRLVDTGESTESTVENRSSGVDQPVETD